MNSFRFLVHSGEKTFEAANLAELRVLLRELLAKFPGGLRVEAVRAGKDGSQ